MGVGDALQAWEMPRHRLVKEGEDLFAATVAGWAPSGTSSGHGWAFVTRLVGRPVLNGTNRTRKPGLMSAIPSDNLNVHILGAASSTHPFSPAPLSPNIEADVTAALRRRGSSSAKRGPQCASSMRCDKNVTQPPGDAGGSEGPCLM